MANFAIGQKIDRRLLGSNPSSRFKEKIHSRIRLSSIVKEPVKKFLRWFAGSKVLSLPWKMISTPVIYAIESRGRVIISYDDSERKPVLDLIRRIKRETRMILDDNEAYQISMAVKRTQKIAGALAEVGVFRGGSAKLIRESDGAKPLHLFDTFEGIPRVEKIDEPAFYQGQFAACIDEVKSCLSGYQNVYFYKGIFPQTAKAVDGKRFSFIHLDVDTYESTLACLEFFYPRMSPGGVVLSHDYINHDGVKKAFDEFFAEKPEPIIEMSGTQCLVVKI